MVGGLLGQGGFCEVRYCAAENKLTSSRGDDDNNYGGGGNNDPEEQLDASKLLYDSPSPTSSSPQPQSSSSSSTTNMARYAIKYLSPTLVVEDTIMNVTPTILAMLTKRLSMSYCRLVCNIANVRCLMRRMMLGINC